MNSDKTSSTIIQNANIIMESSSEKSKINPNSNPFKNNNNSNKANQGKKMIAKMVKKIGGLKNKKISEEIKAKFSNKNENNPEKKKNLKNQNNLKIEEKKLYENSSKEITEKEEKMENLEMSYFDSLNTKEKIDPNNTSVFPNNKKKNEEKLDEKNKYDDSNSFSNITNKSLCINKYKNDDRKKFDIFVEQNIKENKAKKDIGPADFKKDENMEKKSKLIINENKSIDEKKNIIIEPKPDLETVIFRMDQKIDNISTNLTNGLEVIQSSLGQIQSTLKDGFKEMISALNNNNRASK